MTPQLPWSETTEQSLLGAVLIKPEILAWLEVGPACFHSAQNRAVWAAMSGLHSRGLGVDTVSLEAEMQSSGVLSAAGGVAYLSRLAIACATSANADTYAQTLEELRVTREVLRVASGIRGDGELSGEELLDGLIGKLGGIRRAKANELTAMSDTAPEMYRRLIDDVDSTAKGVVGSSFIPTGIGELDFAIHGAPMGTVTAIGGRPGEGKSSTLLTMAEHAASQGKTAVIFTCEDPRDRWTERLLAKHARVSVTSIYARKLNAIDLASLAQAANTVRAIKKLHIVHAHGMTATEMVRTATVLGAEVIGIDYAQKVRAPEPRMKLHDSIEASSKIFGDHAGKSGAAIIILSQLSKEVEKENRRPMLSDLRYGDGLAQEAKLVLLLHDPKSSGDTQLREILIAKRNQGEKDRVVKVNFSGEYCTFSDRSGMDRANDF